MASIVAEPEAAYLTSAEVAQRLRVSPRTVLDWTRTNAIPHVKLAGQKRCLFPLADLLAWEAGAELETVELANGGRHVRPKLGQERDP